MSGRIQTLQRQARELGRLRTGTSTPYTDKKGVQRQRAVRSDTWVVSSHSEDYVRAAAEEWGGTPERWSPQGAGADQWRVITEANSLDAILPPGDPLSQANELWSGGGCQRRCDGITELLSDQPCLCVAEFGDAWHTQPKGNVCAATSRLNVLLPSMPDFGVWRCETHSFYSANEIAATVDVIRSAFEGLVPVRLRIEQRTRVAGGQTKQFPVVALELRGATTQQVLSGQLPNLALTARPAAAAAPTAAEGPIPSSGPNYGELLASATTEAELKDIWSLAKDCGDDTPALSERIKTALAALPPPADPDAVWAQIMSAVPEAWSTVTVEEEFARVVGVPAEKATAAQMATFLAWLTTEQPLAAAGAA